MGKPITRDVIKERVAKAHGDLVTIDESTYIDTHNKCTFIDKDYGPWQALPHVVFRGHCHPKRGTAKQVKSQVISIDAIKERICTVHGDMVTLDESTYVDTHTNARFVDKELGEFWRRPTDILNGRRHPSFGVQQRVSKKYLSLSDFKDRLRIIHGDLITLDDSTYKNVEAKARFIDKEYGEWWSRPWNILKGRNHPRRHHFQSQGEVEINEFLKGLGVNTELRKICVVNAVRKEIDIFIPEKNIGIEYNGLYWHSGDRKQRDSHFTKRLFFEQLGITVMQFNSYEWEFKKDIVKSMIKSKIGLAGVKLQARKLTLFPVDSDKAQEFLEENHLMGRYASAAYIGLYDGELLVSLLGYKRCRGEKDGFEITRFCNKLDTSVAGGLSRLMKFVENLIDVKIIRSYVDLRYATGNSLLSLGFNLIKTHIGFEWTDGSDTYPRQQCMANLDDRGLTEREQADEFKWEKIYDAGQALFEKRF